MANLAEWGIFITRFAYLEETIGGSTWNETKLEINNNMPPSGFSKKAVKGALQFISSCYEDLQAEVLSGKHKSVEAAIEFELKGLDKALSQLHITPKGRIVKRRK